MFYGFCNFICFYCFELDTIIAKIATNHGWRKVLSWFSLILTGWCIFIAINIYKNISRHYRLTAVKKGYSNSSIPREFHATTNEFNKYLNNIVRLKNKSELPIVFESQLSAKEAKKSKK